MSKKRKHVLILFGPRKTGKSKLASHLKKEWELPVHFGKPQPQEAPREDWIIQQWNLARQKAGQSDHNELLLILDDIHKIPQWASSVAQCWEEDSREGNRIKVLLIGTASKLEKEADQDDFPLKRKAKWYWRPLWSYPEIKQVHGRSPMEYAWFGGYPGPANKAGKEANWKRNYLEEVVQPLLNEEVFLEHRIDKPFLLHGFLQKGALNAGKVTSFTHFLKTFPEASNTITLSRYLDILSEAGLITSVPKFDPQGKRQRGSSPKLLPYDPGLPHAFEKRSLSQTLKDQELCNQVIQRAIGNHLLKHQGPDTYRLYYWKDRQFEVDFILERKGRTILVETEKGTWQQDRGLKAFYRQFDLDKVILIGKDGISWEEFLEIDPRSLF